MQPVLTELESLIAAFVERDLGGTLVVACNDVESLHVAELLARLDERSESDLFLSFASPARTAAAFVDAVADSIALQQAELTQQLGSGAALPDFPSLARAAAPPIERMQALIGHVLGLFPSGDHRLVWSLLPAELPPDFSAELAEPLLRAVQDARVRLVLRDDRSAPRAFDSAQSWPDEHVLAYSLDLSLTDTVAAAVAAARNPDAPAGARVQALMELAHLDLGHGRHQDAEHKFRGCAQFYARTHDSALEALALAGVAEVQRARNEFPAARLTYETALLKAAATQAFPVTLQIVVALADTCFALELWADAEGYYRLADALADKLLRPHIRADVQESIGACRLAQGAEVEAARIWIGVAELCRALDYPKRRQSVLRRLAACRVGFCPKEQTVVDAHMREVRPC